jgi:hypothetical protein
MPCVRPPLAEPVRDPSNRNQKELYNLVNLAFIWGTSGVQDQALEHRIVNRLVDSFYELIDTQYATFCSLTSRLAYTALSRAGVEAELIPCQLLGLQDTRGLLVGFQGHLKREGKWDGHVVCGTRHWIVDAAISHLRREAGLNVPLVALARRLTVPSQLIALKTDPRNNFTLLWSAPPEGADIQLPDQPVELFEVQIERMVQTLLSADEGISPNAASSGSGPRPGA